jgi:hypothetical protein
MESILPPAGPLRRYSVIGLIDATGTGLFAAVSTLFFTRVVELPVGQVGLGLSLAGLAALLGAITLPAPVRPARAAAQRGHGVLRDWRFLTVSLLNGLLMTYGSIFTVALPLWVVERTSAPAWMVAALFALNTFLAITLCVRLSRGAQSLVGAARAIRRAGAALLAACLVFAVSGSVGPALALTALAAGCVLLTIGELLQSAGAWGISYDLARPERQGEYLGAFSMGTRIYDTVGPVLAVGLVLNLGVAEWVLMGALLLGISLALTPAVRAATPAQHDAVLNVRCPAQPGGHEPG